MIVGTETPFGIKTAPVSTPARTHQERAGARPGVPQQQVHLKGLDDSLNRVPLRPVFSGRNHSFRNRQGWSSLASDAAQGSVACDPRAGACVAMLPARCL